MNFAFESILKKAVPAFVSIAIGVAALLPVSAAASTLAVDRGLPSANLNNAAGGDRSNVAWGFNGGTYWAGDTFSLTGSSIIDQLTVWLVTSPSKGPDFGDAFSSLSLYLGSTSGTEVDNVSTAGFAANVSDNADVSVSAVTYDGGADYQGSSGSFLNIWELTFSNLGFFAAGEYLFSLTGSPTDDPTFLHASNAALGGEPADGADNLYYWLFGSAGAPSLEIGGTINSNGSGWDKSSDLNLQVYVTAVPVPAALPLLLGALGLLGGASMLQRKKVVA